MLKLHGVSTVNNFSKIFKQKYCKVVCKSTQI